MALLAEQIPENHGKLIGLIIDADIFGARENEIFLLAAGGDAGKVAFDVGGEYRNAGARESFGDHLQRYGLAGSGCTGDEPVAIGELQRQVFRLVALADENLAVAVGARSGRARG